MKFNTTNTLTKASWIFKGMSMPNSSSFWSYNKTDTFCCQLSYHMFLMAFILCKTNSSSEEYTASRGHITEGTFLTNWQFLATANSDVGTGSQILKVTDTLPMPSQHRPCQNSDKSGLLSLWPFGGRRTERLSQTHPTGSLPKASRYDTFKRRICLMAKVHMQPLINSLTYSLVNHMYIFFLANSSRTNFKTQEATLCQSGILPVMLIETFRK